MGRLHRVAGTKDVPPGGGIGVEVEGRRLALFNVGGTFYAIDDTCPHSGAPLSEGDLEDENVVCPWHASMFNLRDGKVLCPPADEDVATYRVEVEGDDVKVEIP